jgi:arylsulfatase A-like enzyme
MDEQVGKLLQEIKELGLSENTIIVLWGDHGYKMGEYGGWAKHTNLSIDTRAPLIMYMPGMKGKGMQAKSYVEFIDVYPTLAQAAGFTLPSHLQGKSFLPLLDRPEANHKDAAYSQFTDWNKTFRGYSVRTADHRYTAWYSLKGADSGKIIGREFYDLKTDAQERRNIATDKKVNQKMKKLHEMVIRENRLERFVN